MSEEVTCDVCRKTGRRGRMRHCPEGWFYGEFQVEGEKTLGPYVIIVCSVECQEAFWLLGPGDLKTSPPYIVMSKANRDVEEEDQVDSAARSPDELHEQAQ